MRGRTWKRELAPRGGRKARVVWDAAVDLRPGEDGKRRRAVRRGFPTRKAAEDWLADVRTKERAGDYVPSDRLTTAEYLDRWLEGLPDQVAPTTFSSYASHVRLYLRPRLGRIKLQALGQGDVKALYGGLRAEGKSAATVRRIHATLHRALADAVDDKLLRGNPASLPRKRLPRVERYRPRTWGREQLSAFLSHVEGDRLSALWRLAALSGMRRGELCGLLWEDTDVEAGRVQVRRALLSLGHRLIEGEPKSGKDRVVDLDTETTGALMGHAARQAEEIDAWGEAYQAQDRVFCRENGSSLHPDWLSKRFRQLAEEAGLPPIRFHDLRHSHASLLLAAGEHPKVVQERLGHHSISLTLDTYSHLVEGLQRQAAERGADLLRGGPAPNGHQDGRNGQAPEGSKESIRR